MSRIETVVFTDRVKKPLRLKLNPLWWFMNAEEPWPPGWYLPGRLIVIRTICWYLRNPLQNFGHYVLGVHDRNYEVYGPCPVMTHMWEDAAPPRTGWKWSVIKLGWLRLPFISYSGRILFYAGWQPNGFAGLKFNIKNVSMQLW